MPEFSAGREGISPTVGNDNWALNAASGEVCRVTSVGWEGEATASTAMRTRVCRSSGGVTPTDGDANVARTDYQIAGGNLVQFATGWGTQPTAEARMLLPQGWNAHGGIYYWHASLPGEEFFLLGAGHISARALLGTGQSTYHVFWRE